MRGNVELRYRSGPALDAAVALVLRHQGVQFLPCRALAREHRSHVRIICRDRRGAVRTRRRQRQRFPRHATRKQHHGTSSQHPAQKNLFCNVVCQLNEAAIRRNIAVIKFLKLLEVRL